MDTICLNGITLAQVVVNTVVIGSGASGYNAADCLFQKGQSDIALVTDHRRAGTSRNTGSDKQTYYKLSLAGDSPDSVNALAQVLYQGRCVDGDIALCEAALSAQGFYKLVELGVPFPKNAFGEYVGYKTDHDPSKRATSVGPYTSKLMTESLERSVLSKSIALYDNHQVIRILTNQDKTQVLGILCLNTVQDADHPYTLFRCKNVIYATGGPASMYADSVYPHSHFGASGLAFEAGVLGKNLTEWQYGLASVNPRWNVSGTYMQVLPKFISTDPDGENPREFLLDFFSDMGDMLTKIFLKGYQWPFDVRKIDGGSSIIDILVYMESCMNGRRIFLDFRQNPKNIDVDFSTLSPEAKEYLKRADACFGTPLERLRHMNQPAVDFYLDKGVDLSTEMLEIALCAQHNNGGLSMDKWWQTNLNGFFAVGEVAGSHGVYRPGGSALNAGQVGSARAAEYVAAKGQGTPGLLEDFLTETTAQIQEMLNLGNRPERPSTIDHHWSHTTQRMSKIGAAIRSSEDIRKAVADIQEELSQFDQQVFAAPAKLWRVYRLRDLLISQYVYLSAMADYVEAGGKSRGSALYTDEKGNLPYSQLPELFRFQLEDVSIPGQIQEIQYGKSACTTAWRDCRPMPTTDDFFENVWRDYRENGNIL